MASSRENQLLRLNQMGASTAPLPPWLNPKQKGIPEAPAPLGVGRPSDRTEAPAENPRAQLASLLGPNRPAQPGLPTPDPMEYLPPNWLQEGPPGFAPDRSIPPPPPGLAENPNPGTPPPGIPGGLPPSPHGVMPPPGGQFPPGTLEGRTRMPPDLSEQLMVDNLLKNTPPPNPLEGRTRLPDDVTRMLESERLTRMQQGAPPTGGNLDVPGMTPPGVMMPRSMPQNAPGGAPPHLTPEQLDEIMGKPVRRREILQPRQGFEV